MSSTVKAARAAGFIYLSMVLTGPLSLIYLPGKLIVRGNATATAANVLSHENLTSLWIITDLWTHIIFICLGVALYRLLNVAGKYWALLMLGFVLVSAAVGFTSALNNIAAVTLFRGADFLGAVDEPLRESLGMLFLRLHSESNFINELFWGLWLFPFGLLVFRCRFIPRWIGVWLIVNCCAYLVLSPIALLWPTYYGAAFRYSQPFLWGEIAVMLWLLIKGAKPQGTRWPIAGEILEPTA